MRDRFMKIGLAVLWVVSFTAVATNVKCPPPFINTDAKTIEKEYTSYADLEGTHEIPTTRLTPKEVAGSCGLLSEKALNEMKVLLKDAALSCKKSNGALLRSPLQKECREGNLEGQFVRFTSKLDVVCCKWASRPVTSGGH